MGGNQSLLELLDIYSDLIEKQADTISQLTELLRKQSIDLHHLETIYGFTGNPEMDETTELPFP